MWKESLENLAFTRHIKRRNEGKLRMIDLSRQMPYRQTRFVNKQAFLKAPKTWEAVVSHDCSEP